MMEEPRVRRNIARTIFGFGLAAAAIAAFFIFDDRTTRLDIAIAGAILLGGAYVDLTVIRELIKIATPFLPWGKK